MGPTIDIYKLNRKRINYMSHGSEIHYKIDTDLFRQVLKENKISMRSMENPNSPNYIGVCAKTIQRCLVNGYCTKRTLNKLSKIVDVKLFIINDIENDIENYIEVLQLENEKLRNALDQTKQIIENVLKEIS